MKTVEALIEDLPGDNRVYELKGGQQLVRVYDMPEEITWPYYYGCIPGIEAPDGAFLDVFVVSQSVLERGSRVKVKIADGFEFTDRGQADPKLIGVEESAELPNTAELDEIYQKIKTFIAAKKEHSARVHEPNPHEFGELLGGEKAEALLVQP